MIRTPLLFTERFPISIRPRVRIQLPRRQAEISQLSINVKNICVIHKNGSDNVDQRLENHCTIVFHLYSMESIKLLTRYGNQVTVTSVRIHNVKV